MTYPKKFFWIYLTTISVFLIGIQHLQNLNTPRSYTCKKVKKSCVKSYSHSYDINAIIGNSKVISPLPISANLIKHGESHFSVFQDKRGFSHSHRLTRTKIKVGKDGQIKVIDILGQRGHGSRKKRARRYHDLSNLQFIPGSIDGKPADLWVRVDFRH
ncbi:MAG: hypothetical protein AAF696_18345 [Bacteroidota bacterium]